MPEVSIPGIDTVGQEHSSQQRCVDKFPEVCPIGVKEALHRDLDAGQAPLGGHGLGRRHRII